MAKRKKTRIRKGNLRRAAVSRREERLARRARLASAKTRAEALHVDGGSSGGVLDVYALAPIAGGRPVDLPIHRIASAYRLAWLAASKPPLLISIRLPHGSRYSFEQPGIEGTSIEAQADGARISFAGGGAPLDALAALGQQLVHLPGGSVLELEVAGLLRLRGRVAGRRWMIAESFPQVSAAQLQGALSMSADIDAGAEVTTESKRRAAEVLRVAL